MPPRDLAALERGLRRGEKRVAPHRNRRRSGMRGLPGEPQHVTLDAERAEHDAGRLVHRLEHRPLLDVQLEIGARVDLSSARRCASSMRSSATPFSASASTSRVPWRSFRSRTVSIFRLPAAAADPSRLRPNRAPSSSAQSTSFSVTGGVDRGVHAQRFERRQSRRGSRRASRRWAPNRGGCRRSPWPATRRARVTQLFPAESVSTCSPSSGGLPAKPFTRVAPDGSPCEALRALGRAGARRELAQIGNHTLCIHGDPRRCATC